MIPHYRIWRVLVLVLLGWGYGGCAWFGTNAPPEWILSPYSTYPPDQYLTGIGEGDSRDQAEKRAYAAIARVFSANITAHSMDRESYSLEESENTSRTQRQLQIDHRTQVTTHKLLENVKILDVWYQPSTHHFFALAGLDRRKAEEALLERLSSLNATIEQMLEQARVHPQKIQRIRGYAQTLNLLHERQNLIADLRVIQTSGDGLPAPYRLPEVQKEFLDFVANELRISVALEGENHEELERAILESLKQEGLLGGAANVEAIPGSEDLAVRGQARLWPVDLPDPLFKYVRWCADIDIFEHPSRRLVGIISQTGREGHITENEAKVRASHAMQESVAQEVTALLTRSIFQKNDQESGDLHTPRACPQFIEKPAGDP